jgi:hypothetical protein
MGRLISEFRFFSETHLKSNLRQKGRKQPENENNRLKTQVKRRKGNFIAVYKAAASQMLLVLALLLYVVRSVPAVGRDDDGRSHPFRPSLANKTNKSADGIIRCLKREVTRLQTQLEPCGTRSYRKYRNLFSGVAFLQLAWCSGPKAKVREQKTRFGVLPDVKEVLRDLTHLGDAQDFQQLQHKV